MQFVHQVLPAIVPFSFGEEEVNFDEAITAVCTISKGDLPIKIWWTLSTNLDVDRNLSSSDGVLITRNSQKISVLAIDAVKATHRGNYTCFAQNHGGKSQHSAFLYVNGDFKFLLVLSFAKNYPFHLWPTKTLRSDGFSSMYSGGGRFASKNPLGVQ